MGMIIGGILIGIALSVGISITVIANNSVKNYKEDQFVAYQSKHPL